MKVQILILFTLKSAIFSIFPQWKSTLVLLLSSNIKWYLELLRLFFQVFVPNHSSLLNQLNNEEHQEERDIDRFEVERKSQNFQFDPTLLALTQNVLRWWQGWGMGMGKKASFGSNILHYSLFSGYVT